ncbi:tripeptidyl-peptidase I, partial [Phenoliferia sp. Uapishka_3]
MVPKLIVALAAMSLFFPRLRAAPTSRLSRHTVEERLSVPRSWRQLEEKPSLDSTFELSIGLRQSNLHRLDEELNAVSQPASKNYGKHWTAQQVAEFFRPAETTSSAVSEWLLDAGISKSSFKSSRGGHWMKVMVTVAEAEALLDTNYQTYVHEEGFERIGCSYYSVPSHVRDHIEVILPTVHFDRPHNDGVVKRSLIDEKNAKLSHPLFGSGPKAVPDGFGTSDPAKHLANCSMVTTLDCLRKLYNIGDYTQTEIEKNSFGIDAKLGLLGTTFIFSSGDNGVAGNEAASTRHVDLERRPADHTVSYSELLDHHGGSLRKRHDFQSRLSIHMSIRNIGGIPFRATQVQEGASVEAELPNSEIACQQVILSSGGFSNNFPMPDYQSEAVTSYLKNFPPPYTAKQYNNTGRTRAYPDLAANGANYPVFIQGTLGLLYGTSASAPVVASLITLINDARIAANKSPVGFINPAIYSGAFSEAFNDITEGGNAGCGTGGFSAETGWDPVTVASHFPSTIEESLTSLPDQQGLGTPNFEKLLSLFLALP